MTWKSFLPLAGKKSVRKKLNEIEAEAATLPVIFGMFFAKTFENMVTMEFVLALKFLTASIAVAMMYVYKHEAKERAAEAAEAAEEVIESE